MVDRGEVQGGTVGLPRNAALIEGAEILDVPHADGEGASTPDIWENLSRLGRWAESEPTDLPADLAINHDHYLHGRPKRS